MVRFLLSLLDFSGIVKIGVCSDSYREDNLLHSRPVTRLPGHSGGALDRGPDGLYDVGHLVLRSAKIQFILVEHKCNGINSPTTAFLVSENY